MKKFKQLKQAIKNTPPDRLAKIEYQSHFMQILGVSLVCGILIWKGYWWIIFAFIFSLGVSLSQGISAYQKYHVIKDIVGETYNFKKDKSFTRKRNHVNTSVYGWWTKWFVMAWAVLFALFTLPYDTWYLKILFTLWVIVLYIFLYFYMVYWIAKQFYKEVKK